MYSLRKIAGWLGQQCDRYLPLKGFAIDSREVVPWGLFFALKGEKVDGHSFLGEVAARGAFAAVVDKGYQGPDYGLWLFRVHDVVVALQEVAKRALQERKSRVIGITGSIGKTTTKEFIYEMLSKKFRVHKGAGSRNSQRTLPLVILEANGDEEFLVLEMSMSEKGHIRKLVEIAPPQIVVLTLIALSHPKNFSGIDRKSVV